MGVLDLFQKVNLEGLFLVTDPGAPINSGEVRGVTDEGGDNGTSFSPGAVSFPIRGVRDMDGVEKWMRGDVGDETSRRDWVLVLGRLIVDFRHGAFAFLRHRLGSDG